MDTPIARVHDKRRDILPEKEKRGRISENIRKKKRSGDFSDGSRDKEREEDGRKKGCFDFLKVWLRKNIFSNDGYTHERVHI